MEAVCYQNRTDGIIAGSNILFCEGQVQLAPWEIQGCVRIIPL